LGTQRRINAIVFSDLGRASSFMSLNWVQQGVQKSLGFTPYPATLNVRPRALEDGRVWETVRKESPGIPLPANDGAFCSARLYPIEIETSSQLQRTKGAVLVPEVNGYPNDKLEIIAPVRIKDAYGLNDGDELTVEFVT
jgi:riboflavin kinase